MSEDLDLSETSEQASVKLSYGDTKLFEKLYGILQAHDLSAEACQDILHELVVTLQSPIKKTKISSIHSLASKCKMCPNMNHDASLPSWNIKDPDVVFITEGPRSFSPDGKDLFISALSQAGFESSNCCLTYSTRCTKGSARSAEEIKNCSDYLFAEIEAWKPKLIVPLGSIPSKELLGPELKMTSSISHHKIIWLGPWAILPCYSPDHASAKQQNLIADFKRIIKYAYEFTYKEN